MILMLYIIHEWQKVTGVWSNDNDCATFTRSKRYERTI